MHSLKVMGLATGILAGTATVSAAAIVTNALNLRTGPGTFHEVITAMPAGAEVGVVNCSGAWCAVNYRGMRGYASSAYLEGPNVVGPPVVVRSRNSAPRYYDEYAYDYDPAYYYDYGPRFRVSYRDRDFDRSDYRDRRDRDRRNERSARRDRNDREVDVDRADGDRDERSASRDRNDREVAVDRADGDNRMSRGRLADRGSIRDRGGNRR